MSLLSTLAAMVPPISLPPPEPGTGRVADAAAGAARRASEAAAALDAGPSSLAIFHGYVWVFVVAFLGTLIATPIARRVALKYGVVDRPSVARKVHRMPVPYMGGVAVFAGLIAAILFTYTNPLHGLVEFHDTRAVVSGIRSLGVPFSIVLGMTIIMVVGLIDDAMGIDPRAKVAGQLFAAAALAYEDVGVKVAAGVMLPLAKALGIPTFTPSGGVETIAFHIPLPLAGFGMDSIPIDLVYWTGTAIIAVFVLGGCNASNLIDGLDGLLSGVTAIAAGGLLVVALALAVIDDGGLAGAGGLDAGRIILCMALLGACLGFLPHNFNPATIFLGDAGSLLLGYCTIVIILTLGDTGKTHLVLAGLIIYAIPIIDTALAIIRRKVSGKKMSDADDQHLHHMLKRSLGVKGAVLTLYALAAGFAVLGVALSEGRGRVTYALALVFASFIGVTAFKIARRDALEKQAAKFAGPTPAADVPAAPALSPAHPKADGVKPAPAPAVEQPRLTV